MLQQKSARNQVGIRRVGRRGIRPWRPPEIKQERDPQFPMDAEHGAAVLERYRMSLTESRTIGLAKVLFPHPRGAVE
jgi:hypothetical protein